MVSEQACNPFIERVPPHAPPTLDVIAEKDDGIPRTHSDALVAAIPAASAIRS
jgi:hypothetical protein